MTESAFTASFPSLGEFSNRKAGCFWRLRAGNKSERAIGAAGEVVADTFSGELGWLSLDLLDSSFLFLWHVAPLEESKRSKCFRFSGVILWAVPYLVWIKKQKKKKSFRDAKLRLGCSSQHIETEALSSATASSNLLKHG